MTQQNQNTITLNDKQLKIIQEALDKSWDELSCNDDNEITIDALNISNKIDEIVKKNKQMDIDLEYNYNLHKQLPPITDEDIKNLPHPPKELLEGLKDTEDFIKEAEDKIINCYYSWREEENEEEGNLRYSYGEFDDYCNYIELDEEYDDIIIKKARERASKFFVLQYYNELMKITKNDMRKIKVSDLKVADIISLDKYATKNILKNNKKIRDKDTNGLFVRITKITSHYITFVELEPSFEKLGHLPYKRYNIIYATKKLDAFYDNPIRKQRKTLFGSKNEVKIYNNRKEIFYTKFD